MPARRLPIDKRSLSPGGLSDAAKPIVASVFPISARIVVGNGQRCDVLRVLKAELRRYAQSQWRAPGRLQGLLLEIERQDRLRMQRACHVTARPIVVKAPESDIFGPQVRANAAQEGLKRHTAPLTDLTPAFHTDMPCDLLFLRQCAQLGKRPGPLIVNQARHLQAPLCCFHRAHLPFRVVRVEAERTRSGAGRIGLCEPVRIEQGGLDAIVEAQHSAQCVVHSVIGRQIAAGQQQESAEGQAATQQKTPIQVFEIPLDLFRSNSRSLLVIHGRGSAPLSRRSPTHIEISVRGKRTTSERCTSRKPTIRLIKAKWMQREMTYPPNRSVNQPSCTGFHIETPVSTVRMTTAITPA